MIYLYFMHMFGNLLLSTVEKRAFSPDWRWAVWISVILTIGDVLAARKKKNK